MDSLKLMSGYGDLLFEIWLKDADGYPCARYYYKILGMPSFGCVCVLEESQECFDSLERARFAAVGHISIIENGEG